MSCNRIGVGYVLVTNAVTVENDNLVYGINPASWTSLPCEGVALLKIRNEPPVPGCVAPVEIAVPSKSTVTTIGEPSCCCRTVTNIALINTANDPVIGTSFINNTEHLVYFNKVRNIIRIMDCCEAKK